LWEIDFPHSLGLLYSAFTYYTGLTMTNSKFDKLLGGPPRQAETKLTQRHMDIAASIQVVTEVIVLRLAETLRRETGVKNLCLAGGVALNCVANGRILREGGFENIWIQPAAGDAGGALGAASIVWHEKLGHDRTTNGSDRMSGAYLGPRALGGLLVLAQGSVIAPFIYTLF